MWAKLTTEYLNLNQVARVRFSKAWQNGVSLPVAEVDFLVAGDLKTVIRYRGADAELLQQALQLQDITNQVGSQVDISTPRMVPSF